ncbi:MAG TPA: 4a-hydroxytetrahydrobiopterin dehydratase [Candidatus Saccharimonadales bacterium]|nr:4a-hydroxytetrahydrobiopterin dehydratase [Candidatus Saccharimonadales bacterium]
MNWQEKDGKLYKEFVFDNFQHAFSFMQAVAMVAEEQNHHPLWTNEWNKVEFWLSTHDAGGVTDKDRALADAIDETFDRRKMEGKDVEKTTPHKEHAPDVSVTDPGDIVSRVREVKLFTDGGSRGNPGPSASGYVLLDMEDTVIYKGGLYLGITTNNQAEYTALKLGLEEAKNRGVQEVHVYMDSLLVVNQMKGVFKVKNRDLWPIHDAIKTICKDFKKVSFNHVPRELNKLADGMVNEILDSTDLSTV